MANETQVNKATRKKATTKVWHIAEFSDRFEYREDAFKLKPLNYVKQYVGSGYNAVAAAVCKQVEELRLHPHFCRNKGAFSELKDRAANMGILHRGYLLDGKCRPAPTKQIAAWLGMTAAETNKTLSVLSEVGLIERVPLPNFDEPKPTVGPEPSNPTKPAKDKDKPAGGGKKRGARPSRANSQPVRGGAAAQDGENPREKKKNKESLQNGKTANDNSKSVTANDKRHTAEKEKKTAAEKPQPEGQGEDQAQGQGGTQRPQPGHHPAAIAAENKPEGSSIDDQGNRHLKVHCADGNVKTIGTAEGNMQAQADAEPLPPAAVPTDADGTQEGSAPTAGHTENETDVDGGATPQSGTSPHSGSPPLLRNMPRTERALLMYDKVGHEFAMQVYQAIGFPAVAGSPMMARELGCFAKLWRDALDAQLGSELLAELWDKSIAKAKQLSRIRHKLRKPGAVFSTVFNERLNGMIAEGRASPKAAVNLG